jgi:hypothetical protein
MRLSEVLDRLTKVRGKNGRYTASCPAHEDKSPSLALRELDDGRILLHCFGGCSTDAVLGAIGLDMTDLFPDKVDSAAAPVRNPFSAADLLRIIYLETLIVNICAEDMSQGKALTSEDRERLKLAAERISEAHRYANV